MVALSGQVFVISLLDPKRNEVEHVFMFDRGEHWPVLHSKVGAGMIGYVVSVGTSMRGEEFIVLLPDTMLVGAQRIAERLRASTETVCAQSKKGEVGVTVSFGVAEFMTSFGLLSAGERETFTVDNLIDQADQALYVAKREGHNCVRVYPDDIK